MKQIAFIAVACLFTLGIFSCSKKNNSTVSAKGHTMKFIITVTVPPTFKDVVTASIDGAPVSGSGGTLWSLNGTTQSNQSGIVFSSDAFPPGKPTTLTIQSVVPISQAATGLSFHNSQNLAGCTLSYQAIIDGQTINNDQNISITSSNTYEHTYNYGNTK